jgi:hypothetical protein
VFDIVEAPSSSFILWETRAVHNDRI